MKWSTKALKRMGNNWRSNQKTPSIVREVPTFHSGHKKSNY
nr:hypothetical protein [Mycoplasmopsis bovis]